MGLVNFAVSRCSSALMRYIIIVIHCSTWTIHCSTWTAILGWESIRRRSKDHVQVDVTCSNVARVQMNAEQTTIYIQASRVRSALQYLPNREANRLRLLWEYGLMQELVRYLVISEHSSSNYRQIAQAKAMHAIGICWLLSIDIEVPQILGDVYSALIDFRTLDDISTETEDGDPSRLRDITDPIYSRCWWTAEALVGADDGYDKLARLLSVSH